MLKCISSVTWASFAGRASWLFLIDSQWCICSAVSRLRWRTLFYIPTTEIFYFRQIIKFIKPCGRSVTGCTQICMRLLQIFFACSTLRNEWGLETHCVCNVALVDVILGKFFCHNGRWNNQIYKLPKLSNMPQQY